VSVGPDPQVSLQLIEETRRKINRLFEEVARLSDQELAPTDYYGEVLKRVLDALQAPAGAVWVRTAQGNVLWDCVADIDADAVKSIAGLGGLRAIAISHPHYYTVLAEWSEAFGGIPVYLHALDRQWVMRPHGDIVHWDGETQPLWDGVTLVRCGGHFPGGSVMHWAQGAGGRGALFTGDVMQVGQDRNSVSFMHSFPNYIPLNAASVKTVAKAVIDYPFETIFGAFARRNVMIDGKAVLARSVERYLEAIA